MHIYISLNQQYLFSADLGESCLEDRGKAAREDPLQKHVSVL